MSQNNKKTPSFFRRSAAAWVDIVLLVGAYIVIGFLFGHIFDADAYPKPTGMQFYSERDFAVYWLFVRTTVIAVVLYMFLSYFAFRGTFGQKWRGYTIFLWLGNVSRSDTSSAGFCVSYSKCLSSFSLGRLRLFFSLRSAPML